MKTWPRGLIATTFLLLLPTACTKPSNPLNPLLFKNSESQYQTITEEAAPAMTMPDFRGPPQNSFPPSFDGPFDGGPPGPPPLVDPLTNGPALPPPPPPLDFEGEGPPPSTLVIIPRCGDKRLQQKTATGTVAVTGSTGNSIEVTFPIAGEQCEDGNTISGDGCSEICIEEYCGNGIIEPEHGEQCDGGFFSVVGSGSFSIPAFTGVCSPNNPGCIGKMNQPQAWNCDKFCRLIICGDGVVQLGGTGIGPSGQAAKPAEQCDLGPRNGDCSGCTIDCTLQSPCSTTNPGCTCPSCPTETGCPKELVVP